METMTPAKLKRGDNSKEQPPNSRLFIVAPKEVDENKLRDAFSGYGDITHIHCLKDKTTGEKKGSFFVHFAKASQAAKALEGMRGTVMENKVIKIFVASNPKDGQTRDDNNEENLKRLFIVLPRTVTDNDLHECFKQFGSIEHANIVKNKETGQSKGFAYVKFSKFSEAARAVEECDKFYKVDFAAPIKPKTDVNQKQQIEQKGMYPVQETNFPSTNFKPNGVFKLFVTAEPNVNQDQMWKLFDVLPSMDYCQVLCSEKNRNIFEVVYTNTEWGLHALKKFHGFEYPPGYRLIVKSDTSQELIESRGLKRPHASSTDSSDISHLTETMVQASSMIQQPGNNAIMSLSSLETNYCNKNLPPRQPLTMETKPEATLFIICTPTALPKSVMVDVFSRFDNLIDAFMLPNKKYGYAKYSTKESAKKAMELLHGAEVLGVKLNIMEAEEKNKRLKEAEEKNKKLKQNN